MNQSDDKSPKKNISELFVAIAFLIFLLIMFRIWHGKQNSPSEALEPITHITTPTETPMPSDSTLQHETK
jgi:hypothetical protein